MVNEQVVPNCESGVRNCPICLLIDALDMQACDTCIMHVGWQVYYLDTLKCESNLNFILTVKSEDINISMFAPAN